MGQTITSGVTAIRPELPVHYASDPTGYRIPIPLELFCALRDMMVGKKTGSLLLEYKSGGIAGIELKHRIR
jgi:hypothetical protein